MIRISKIKVLLLLVIPFIYIIIAHISFSAFGSYYLKIQDPEYVYLLNGLHLANFQMKLGHVDHPGSPLQYLTAINIWIIQLFKQDKSMTENVISNPELYLKSIHFSIIYLTSISMIFAGWIIYKIQDIISAVFIQFIPMSTVFNILIISRTIPENFENLTLLFLVLLCIMFLNKERFRYSIKTYSIFFALAIGYGTAMKINFAPFFFIPVFIIPGRKNKLRYLIFTIIAFFVFAIPVIFNIEKFYYWIRGILTHNGLYGMGKEEFTNKHLYIENLKKLINLNAVFFYFQLFIICLILILNRFKTNFTVKEKEALNFLIGTIISFIGLVIMVAKHFRPHYFKPYDTLYIFEIFLIFSVLIKYINKDKLKFIRLGLFSLIITVLLFFEIKTALPSLKYKDERTSSISAFTKSIQKFKKEETLFIGSGKYENAFVESALYFGYIWSGKRNIDFIPALKKYYPNTFIYNSDKKPHDFRYWDTPIDTLKLNKNIGNGVIVYLGKNKDFKKENLLDQISKIYNKSFTTDTLFYLTSNPDEIVYRLNFLN